MLVTAAAAARLYGGRPLCRKLVWAWEHGCPWDVMACREAAYARAGERYDERGLPISRAQEPAATPAAAAALGASGQRPPTLSVHKSGESGFFGVSKTDDKGNKSTPWLAQMHVPGTAQKMYIVGLSATKAEAARAYDTEVSLSGWTHLKRLNFPRGLGGQRSAASRPPPPPLAGAPGSD